MSACSSPDPGDLFAEDPGGLLADGGGGSGGGANGGSGGGETGSCSAEGTWATFVEVGVGWQSGTIAPGAGTVRQWILSDRQIAGGAYMETARACGVGAQGVPLGSPWFATNAFPSLGLESEWTGVTFAEALFDDPEHGPPRVALNVQVETADPTHASVGDRFTSEALPFTFGVEGLNQNDWPPIEMMAPLMVDHDNDGNPGISGTPFSGPVPGEPEGTVFLEPRLDLNDPPTRASQLFMALRTRAALQGTLVSCDPPRMEGEVLPESLKIETRNVACTVVETGAPCNPDQVKFIDTNLPVFEPNNTSRVVSIKVDPSTTCADVRAMQF